MKKLLALTLCLALCLGLCAPAFADDEERETCTSGDFQYALLDDGSAEITEYTGTAQTLAIPDRLDGHAVTAIGDAAFSWCYNLTSVTIPDSVTQVGANPFLSCHNLSDIRVSQEHPTLAVIDGVLFSKVGMRLVCYPCAFTADSYAIPQGVRRVGDDAFYRCESLQTLTIPDSVTDIGDCAFFFCVSLAAIQIPDSVTTIGDYAFDGCESLTSVTIPDSVTQVGACPFNGGKDPTDVRVSPEHPALAVIDGALYSKEDRRLVRYLGTAASCAIPQGIRVIGRNAFYGCGLQTVTIPDSVTQIDDWAFGNCNNLTTITIPDSVTQIGKDVFFPVFINDSKLLVTVGRDSCAESYCIANHLRYTYPDAND